MPRNRIKFNLTPRLDSSLLRVFEGMKSAETKASFFESPSGSASVFDKIVASTTSKLTPPAVFPFGFAKSPSSRNDSKIRVSSAFDF